MDYFTSDLHFGHSNIIKYCNRPFRDTKEMEEILIRNWNDIVTPEDSVFVLGDVFFCGREHAKDILDRLNGFKYLCRGNHDPNWCAKLPQWLWVKARTQYLDTIWLSHYPYAFTNPDNRIQLHGHTHGRPSGFKNNVDVGVDCWDYRPITLDQALDRIVV